MNSLADVERVLACYPAACRPGRIEALGSAGGSSGARLWRIAAPRRLLLLRRWPREHPDARRLEFIQSAVWHVANRGLAFIAAPLRTEQGPGYIEQSGHLWELSPWLPGAADYLPERRSEKLVAALTALADFHRAAESFPLTPTAPATSPGIAERLARLQSLRSGRLAEIVAAAASCPVVSQWRELASLGPRVAALFEPAAPSVERELATAANLAVALQPCLRDVWHDHVLFEGDRVTGLIDYGAMRIESVAADVARLLGSMAGDDAAAWQIGLAAYEAVRPLSPYERRLLGVFDRSTTLLAACNWLDWVLVEGRKFADPAAVTSRVRGIVARMLALPRTEPP